MTETRAVSVATLGKNEGNSQSIELIDVRTPVEFRELHAEGARNIPLDILDPQVVLRERNGDSNQPLYLICHTGARAKLAAAKLEKAGVENLCLVEGGTDAWLAAGLPVVRGKKAMSLERQVRIAAGSMVFIGSLLAAFSSEYFLILPGFVGAGLVFAGVTDTCGMGMLLAKMPWNQVQSDAPSSS